MLPKRSALSKVFSNEPKHWKKFKTLQEKIKLLDFLPKRNSYAEVVRHYGINKSIVGYIKKNEAAIRSTVSVSFFDSVKKKNIFRM